jgi:hypothetical protein
MGVSGFVCFDLDDLPLRNNSRSSIIKKKGRQRYYLHIGKGTLLTHSSQQAKACQSLPKPKQAKYQYQTANKDKRTRIDARQTMSAIFDFSSLLTVILLLICTCAYLRDMRPTIFDGGKVSLKSCVSNTIVFGSSYLTDRLMRHLLTQMCTS